MPEVLTFKIEDFEGPLDLLLYLVGKNKMNLYDINIMELIEQYTAAIREMQQNRMEVSSEFIDMAAHLVQRKSALLLPRSPAAERMEAELTGRLIEYSACKEVAAQLGSRARDLYTVAREPMPLIGAAEYTRRHDPNWLVQAWFNLMGRSTRKKKPTQEKFEPLVTAPFVSVASRVSHMLRGLLKGSLQKMGELFSHEESRSTNVATFLALLELIRAGRVKVDDSGALQLDRTHRKRKDKTQSQNDRSWARWKPCCLPTPSRWKPPVWRMPCGLTPRRPPSFCKSCRSSTMNAKAVWLSFTLSPTAGR